MKHLNMAIRIGRKGKIPASILIGTSEPGNTSLCFYKEKLKADKRSEMDELVHEKEGMFT